MARPWVKDPRCFQPQRMYHPEDWAAGECDLVLRWDGNHRIVDIKLSDSSSKFATSLPIQLNFYAWLWNQTHEEKCQGIEGWYLGSCERVQPEMNQLNDDYLEKYGGHYDMYVQELDSKLSYLYSFYPLNYNVISFDDPESSALKENITCLMLQANNEQFKTHYVLEASLFHYVDIDDDKYPEEFGPRWQRLCKFTGFKK